MLTLNQTSLPQLLTRTQFSLAHGHNTLDRPRYESSGICYSVLVLAVVGSHIQRIVLAPEDTTVTQQISHRLIECQFRLWSLRGTELNGSHHGDNPLVKPTGIQIATGSYAILQATAPTNVKTVYQASFLHTEGNLDRLRLLSPTHDQRSQQQSGQITVQSVLINKSKFFKIIHRTKIRKGIQRSMVVEALSW